METKNILLFICRRRWSLQYENEKQEIRIFHSLTPFIHSPILPNLFNIKDREENNPTPNEKARRKEGNRKRNQRNPIHPSTRPLLSRHTPIKIVLGNQLPRTVLVISPASNSDKEKIKIKRFKMKNWQWQSRRPKEAAFHIQCKGNGKRIEA